MIGCDTTADLFYGYNSTNNDTQYEDQPPSVGFRLLYGPLVPADGEMGYFDGGWMSDYRNLKMTTFGKYTNGTDPDYPYMANAMGVKVGYKLVTKAR